MQVGVLVDSNKSRPVRNWGLSGILKKQQLLQRSVGICHPSICLHHSPALRMSMYSVLISVNCTMPLCYMIFGGAVRICTLVECGRWRRTRSYNSRTRLCKRWSVRQVGGSEVFDCGWGVWLAGDCFCGLYLVGWRLVLWGCLWLAGVCFCGLSLFGQRLVLWGCLRLAGVWYCRVVFGSMANRRVPSTRLRYHMRHRYPLDRNRFPVHTDREMRPQPPLPKNSSLRPRYLSSLF